jgi:hypothetical protein
VGRDAKDIEVIWVRSEGEYFCRGDWTTQIRLNSKENFFFAVIPLGGKRDATVKHEQLRRTNGSLRSR